MYLYFDHWHRGGGGTGGAAVQTSRESSWMLPTIFKHSEGLTSNSSSVNLQIICNIEKKFIGFIKKKLSCSLYLHILHIQIKPVFLSVVQKFVSSHSQHQWTWHEPDRPCLPINSQSWSDNGHKNVRIQFLRYLVPVCTGCQGNHLNSKIVSSSGTTRQRVLLHRCVPSHLRSTEQWLSVYPHYPPFSSLSSIFFTSSKWNFPYWEMA